MSFLTIGTRNDGGFEWLSSLIIGANWLRAYDVNVGGYYFQCDFLGHPIADYDLDADFITDGTCLPLPGTVNTIDQSSPVLANRMYNQAAFVGASQVSYSYNWGDGFC